MVGGGAVGLAIGDSISITERSARIANILGEADIIIESAVALTQEIHDGPFETYTGHGIWAILAKKVSERLGVELDFISYPQETTAGKKMREWIVKDIKPINREKMVYNIREYSPRE